MVHGASFFCKLRHNALMDDTLYQGVTIPIYFYPDLSKPQNIHFSKLKI